MSQQQVVRLVALQHVFWEHELERASEDELEDCRFYRQQCRDELAALKRGATKAPAAERIVAPEMPAAKPAERRFSTKPPAKVVMRASGAARPGSKVPLTRG